MLLGLATVAASGAAVAPDLPLIQDGSIVVDAADFEGNMLRIPENRRAEFRTSYDRIAAVVDNIFVTRSLAARARSLGLDKDPAIQRRMQQLQEGLLADLYVKKMEKDAPKVDLEQRAREVFKAEQAALVKPEEVYFQQILVGLRGRTRDMAAERADMVYAEAAKPDADFLALASKYSDDPDMRRNGGDMGYHSPTTLMEPIRDALAKMSRKGEISRPIETEYGFHIVRFIDRKAARPVKFEDVRKGLIEAERDKLQKARVESLVQEVRGSKTVVVNQENVEKLVVPIDPEEMKRKAAEAAAAPAK
jgi:parvulin-like peptidyl-prolyl isomerase